MMILTLSCKYYKNVTYCTAMEIYDSEYKYLKLMHNYKLFASNAPLTFKVFCFVVDFTSIFSYYHVGFQFYLEVIQIYWYFLFLTVITYTILETVSQNLKYQYPYFYNSFILQYPDHHQNLISSSLYYSGPVHKISSQSVHNFLSNVVHRQTNRRTKQHHQKHNLLCQGGKNHKTHCNFLLFEFES